MNYTLFKSRIRKKFGSLQKFMLLTGVTQKDLDKSFDKETLKGNPVRVRRLLSKAAKVKDVTTSKDVTPALLECIRVAIYTKHKSQSEFCERHKQFTNTWLSALLNGKCPRISKKVGKLLKTLDIKCGIK